MRALGFTLALAACAKPGTDVVQVDAAVELPAQPATCGGGPGVTAQGALYDLQYLPFTFDGAGVVVGDQIVIATPSAALTFATDGSVGDHMRVATRIKLGGELRASDLGHVIIDQNDDTCVAGRFEVALSGRVAGSFHTN